MTPCEPSGPLGPKRSWESAALNELHPDVRAQLRELVLAQGANDAEAAVLLLVIEQLKVIQDTDGVAAAVAAARKVKEIWLDD